MKKLLLLSAIALTASLGVSANSECNPWASNSTTTAVATATVSTTAAKPEKQLSGAEHKTPAKHQSDNMHVSAHQQAISHQHLQK